jgi:hypothetical protein
MDGTNKTEATSCLQLEISSVLKRGSCSGKHSFRFGQFFIESSWRHGKAPVAILQSHSSHRFIFSNIKVCKDANGIIGEKDLLLFP